MNVSHRFLSIPLVWSLLLTIGCATKPVDPLPEETQSGQRTLACRIDGQVWQPYKTFTWDIKGGNNDRLARYSEKSKTLWVGGSNETLGRIDFCLTNVTSVGRYILDGYSDDVLRPVANCGIFSPTYYLSDQTYYTDSTNRGEVVITKLADKIVAGRFSFKALNKKTGKVINVAEGRFDFYYSPGIND